MPNDIQLRVLEKDDLAFLHKLHNNPEVMDFWFSEGHKSMEKIKQNFEKELEDNTTRQFILSNGNERLGFVGIVRISGKHRHAEFVIMIDPAKQGNGYAKTATKLAKRYAFYTLNVHKLSLIVDKENKKAIHIYEQTGFQLEGEMKEHFFVNGTYHDALSMYILDRDYFKATD